MLYFQSNTEAVPLSTETVELSTSELAQSQYRTTNANIWPERYELEANTNSGPFQENTPPPPTEDFVIPFDGGVKNKPCRVVHPHHFSIITPPPSNTPSNTPTTSTTTNIIPQNYIDRIIEITQNREQFLNEREARLNQREEDLNRIEENLNIREAEAMVHEQYLNSRENDLTIPICRDCQRRFPPP